MASWSFRSKRAAEALTERKAFGSVLRAAGYPRHGVADAERIYEELVGTIVKHCPTSSVAVELVLRDGRTFLRITDDAGPSRLPVADLNNLWAETGRVFAMVAGLGGQVAVHVNGAARSVIVDLPNPDSVVAAQRAA